MLERNQRASGRTLDPSMFEGLLSFLTPVFLNNLNAAHLKRRPLEADQGKRGQQGEDPCHDQF